METTGYLNKLDLLKIFESIISRYKNGDVVDKRYLILANNYFASIEKTKSK